MPAPALFVVSGLTQYVGAALAVGLFASVPAPGVAWWRIALAAVVLLVWRRPWRRHWSVRELGLVAAFGTTLATMNVLFYVAIDHLPLGTAVAAEFAGPVAVAAISGGRRERWGIALAGVGVTLLAGVSLGAGGPGVRTGLLAIAGAAVCWAGYIVLGRRVAGAGDGVTRLGLAMAAGAVVLAPLLAGSAAPAVGSWSLMAVLGAVAVLSSVVPYGIEQVVLRRVSAATFAILLATLPATAMVVGALVLGQRPQLLEVVGLVAVSVAIAVSARAPRLREPEAAGPA